MKKRMQCMMLSIVVLLGLAACGKKERGEERGIIGTWETTVNIIGVDVEELGRTGTIAFRFAEDLTGQLIPHVDREAKSEDFTYNVTEDTLEIEFSDGVIWSFPYKLDGDVLTLTQNHCEIIYTRRK